MRRGAFVRFLLLTLAVSLSLFVFGLHRELTRWALEGLLNRNADEFFGGSIRAGKAYLDKELRIHIEHLQGDLQSEAGPIALVVRAIESQGPVTDYFSEEGLLLSFTGARPEDSHRNGVKGTMRLRGGRSSFVDFDARVEDLGLEDIRWLNPESLSAAAGNMRGEFKFFSDARGEMNSSAWFRSEEPGGRIQGRFLDLLTPHLAGIDTKKKIKEMKAAGGLIDFQKAYLEMEVIGSDRIKFFIELAIPDYNLDLNVGIEVRVDEKGVLKELAELVGVLRPQNAG